MFTPFCISWHAFTLLCASWCLHCQQAGEVLVVCMLRGEVVAQIAWFENFGCTLKGRVVHFRGICLLSLLLVVSSLYLCFDEPAFGLSFTSCMIVSSRFASILRDHAFCLGCVESLPISLGTEIVLDSSGLGFFFLCFLLTWVCLFFAFHSFIFSKSWIWEMCCQCSHQGGD